MDIENAFVGSGGHSCCAFMDMKRNSKGFELDNGNMGDFFGIDDLLDFSNEDIGGPIGEAGCTGVSLSIPPETVSSNSSIMDGKCFQAPNTSNALISTEPDDLCVPCDDVAELEWLSNFVEESFSSGDASTTAYSSSFNTAHGEQHNLRAGKQKFQSASPVSALESSACSPETASFGTEMTVPGRARSKRSRTVLCIWNTQILSAGDASANILESSSTSAITTTPTPCPESDTFACGTNSLPSKKPKDGPPRPKEAQDAATQTRRCQHCGTQRTPQWRAGPLGPKTLCNACGVRYKSGRLLPEYRPAASPTFMEAIHSNSHKRVLEMRRQKEEDEEEAYKEEEDEAEDEKELEHDDRSHGFLHGKQQHTLHACSDSVSCVQTDCAHLLTVVGGLARNSSHKLCKESDETK